MASPGIAEATKTQLKALFDQLDPIELIQGIRCVQGRLATMPTLQPEPLKTESAEAFVRKLRTAWHEGEVRPTHRRRKTVERHWRTRADPFELSWITILEQLSLTPDITAKDLFRQLQAENPGHFPDCQLRTLQRGVKQWRSEAAQRLMMSSRESGGELDPMTPGLNLPVQFVGAYERRGSAPSPGI